MAEPIVRPATREDFLAIYGFPPARTIRAFTAELDGKPAGIGGIATGAGQPTVLFSHMTDALKPHRRFIVKAARFLSEMGRQNHAVAVADPEMRLSAKLLSRIGAQHVASEREGEVYKWPTQ